MAGAIVVVTGTTTVLCPTDSLWITGATLACPAAAGAKVGSLTTFGGAATVSATGGTVVITLAPTDQQKHDTSARRTIGLRVLVLETMMLSGYYARYFLLWSNFQSQSVTNSD